MHPAGAVGHGRRTCLDERRLPRSDQWSLALAALERNPLGHESRHLESLGTIADCGEDDVAAAVQAAARAPLTDNDGAPFGGMRWSGVGRELGEEGLDAFREPKHVHVDYLMEQKAYWYPYRNRPAPEAD